MADNDGWTVVRGKGKAKGTSLKRARDECCPGDSSACTGPSSNALQNDNAPSAQQPKMTYISRQPATKGNRRFAERTEEEQCEQLVSAVVACSREVADSPFFARLVEVMATAAAAGHLDHLAPATPQPPPHQSLSAGLQHGVRGAAASDGDVPMCGEKGADGHSASSVDPTARGGGGSGGCGTAMIISGGGGGGGGDSGCGQRRRAGWSAVSALVVYGLGSPHVSRVSRYQLALVLLLRERLLPGLSLPVQLYDPAFDSVDRMALGRLCMEVAAVNEGGARAVSRPTFFYMPHCEAVLYDALLAANGAEGERTTPLPAAPPAAAASLEHTGSGESGSSSGSGLSQVVVLGNSFREYVDRWDLKRAGGGNVAAGPVVRCCQRGGVLELPTPELRFPVPSAFNAMALHIFPPQRLEQPLPTPHGVV